MPDALDWLDGLIAAGRAREISSRATAKAALGPKEPKPKPRAHPERDIQRSVVALVRRCYPAVLLAAVPNEQRGEAKDADARARFGAARKASGVLTGQPDMIVYLPGGRVVLWECKADKGYLSPAQKLVHAQLYDLGHTVEIIRSVEDAVASLARVGLASGRGMRMAVPVQPLVTR